MGKKLKKIEDTNLIYLIGIKKDSNEEKTKLESIKFCENNIIKFFVISDKNEKDIKTFINDLLEQLGIRKIIIKNNEINKPNKNEYKVSFIGGTGIGAKTSLINAIMGKKFDLNTPSTCANSFVSKRIELNNENIDLNLWDTIGQEKFRDITKIFIKDSDCLVFGFAVTSKSGFEEIRDWFKIVKENCNAKLMYLIGNKIDLFMDRKVNEEEARNLPKELNLRYFETSCLTGEGIHNFVYDLANEIIKY